MFNRRCVQKKEKERKKGRGKLHMLRHLQDIVVEGVKAKGAAREGSSWQGVTAERRLEVLEVVEVGGG